MMNAIMCLLVFGGKSTEDLYLYAWYYVLQSAALNTILKHRFMDV